MKNQPLVCVLSVLVLLAAAAGQAMAAPTQFDFTNGDLSATFGPGTLAYRNGATTSSVVSFGTASSFGLPAMPGGDARVMSFPAFAGTQGLEFYPAVPPNGGSSTEVRQYTLIYDLLVPGPASSGWMGLLNTNATNSTDADLWLKFVSTTAGFGAYGQYDGAISVDQWYRLAVTFDMSASPQLRKYVDGAYVGGQNPGWDLTLWAQGSPTHLLTDNNGDTKAGYVSSVYFADQALDAATIAGFGGPSAGGVVPEPAAGTLLVCGGLCLAAVAWRMRPRRQHARALRIAPHTRQGQTARYSQAARRGTRRAATAA